MVGFPLLVFRRVYRLCQLECLSHAAHEIAQMPGARLDVHGDQCKKRTTI